MPKLTMPLLLGALCIGCNPSREPVPTPPAAMPATSPVTLASAAQPAPTSSAFAPPPSFATAEPSASAAPLVSLSEPPTSPPPDLGPDARPVRYTKHVALKSLDGLSAAFKAPLDQYNTTLTVTHNDATQDVHNCAESRSNGPSRSPARSTSHSRLSPSAMSTMTAWKMFCSFKQPPHARGRIAYTGTSR